MKITSKGINQGFFLLAGAASGWAILVFARYDGNNPASGNVDDCMKSKLFFKPENRTVEVEAGTTILDAALDADIDINYDCGGNGACSTCHVIVKEGLTTLNGKTDDELDLLEDAEGVTEFSRLACQCQIGGDLVLVIPPDV